MKKSVNKWTNKDLDWYWRNPFADVNSPDYFERHHWWELATGENAPPARISRKRQQDIFKSLPALRLSLTEALRYINLLSSPDFEVPPGTGAYYELLRRHPLHGILRRAKPGKYGQETSSLIPVFRFLLAWGSRSWPSLGPIRQKIFEITLQQTQAYKGIDHRPMVTNLVEKAAEESGRELIDKLILIRGGKGASAKQMRPRGLLLNVGDAGVFAQHMKLIHNDHIKRLSTLVAAHAEKDDLIVAIRPDVTNFTALANEIKRYLARVKSRSPGPPGRDREKEWLKIISNFERTETDRLSHNKGNLVSQSWPPKTNGNERRAYRRLFNNIKFTPPPRTPKASFPPAP